MKKSNDQHTEHPVPEKKNNQNSQSQAFEDKRRSKMSEGDDYVREDEEEDGTPANTNKDKDRKDRDNTMQSQQKPMK